MIDATSILQLFNIEASSELSLAYPISVSSDGTVSLQPIIVSCVIEPFSIITLSSELSPVVIESSTAIITGSKGDTGASGESFQLMTAQNVSGVTIYAGQAVSVHSSGVGFVLADKAGYSTRAIGLSKSNIPNGFALTAQVGGILDLPDWTQSFGDDSFPPGSRIYLGDSGNLTLVPTSTSGEIVQLVGITIGPKKLKLDLIDIWRKA